MLLLLSMATISESTIIAAARQQAGDIADGIGIGDDCACLPWDEDHYQIVSTDSLLQDIHFTKAMAPRELGHKALAVNLSDIAAMGGTPLYALLNISLPRRTTETWVKQFFLGFAALANEHNVILVGGDTTRSPNIISLTVTAIGRVAKSHVKLRSTAKVGDVIAVTGHLGDARAGLECILKDEEADALIEAHWLPMPQVVAGKILGQTMAVHAMMDISDGLVSDLQKLATASKVGARVDLRSLPTSAALATWALRRKMDTKDFAAAGGEDYQLLVTVARDGFADLVDKLQAQDIKLTAIGEITAGDEVVYERDGKPTKVSASVFSQF